MARRGTTGKQAKRVMSRSKASRPSTKSRKPAQPVFGGSSQAARARGVYPSGQSR